MKTNLVGHVSNLVLAEDGLPSDLWWRSLPVSDLFLVRPRIECLLELAFKDLLGS